ncbi:MAG: hypothetical protein H7288_23430 [Kineosporiaceae bacterium]|nr:hypothetical protein [Aeromicrobium sp.]
MSATKSFIVSATVVALALAGGWGRRSIDWTKLTDSGKYTTPAADIVTVFFALAAVVFATAGWSVWSTRRIISREFRRAVAKDLLAPHLGRWAQFKDRYRAGRAIAQRATEVTTTERTNEAEFRWLLATIGINANAEVPFLVGSRTSKQVTAIAAAYLEYATRLERRGIFSTRSSAVLEREARLARDISKVVATNGEGAPIEFPTAIEFTRTSDSLRIVPLVAPKGLSHDSVPVLADSLVTLLPKGGILDIPGDVAESPGVYAYDGLLPWACGIRMEQDTRSGRYRVHFACTTRRWSAFGQTNRERSKDLIPFLQEDGLLTTSLCAVDVDDRIVLTRRGERVSGNPNTVNSFVTGNLELQSRKGVAQDLDAFGLPDLELAIVREAREETGLILEPIDVALIGIQRAWTEDDRGTWIATFGTTLDLSAKQLAEGIRKADAMEGTWELGNEVYAVALPTDLDLLSALVASFLRPVGKECVTPHAIGAILAVAALRGHDLLELKARSEMSHPVPLSNWWEAFPVRKPLGGK